MLEKFRSFLNKYTDVARTNRFLVLVNFPRVVFDSTSEDRRAGYRVSTFTCESTELPGRNLEVFERRTYGVIEKMPVQTQYNEITLNFFLTANKVSGNEIQEDTGLEVKRNFESWMQYIHSNPTGVRLQDQATPLYTFNFKNEYASTIIIQHFDSFTNLPNNDYANETETYSVTLVDAYPIALGSVSLNWGDDSVMRFPVTFAYTNWYRMGKNRMATGIIK